jgi:hypothetical protein
MAAGDYFFWTQNIEGQRCAPLLWGTPYAIPLVLRWRSKRNGGRMCVRVANSAADRSYVHETPQQITYNQSYREFCAAIPGDTAGTWLTAEGTVGIRLDFALAAGSTYQTATPNQWVAGNFYSTPGTGGTGAISLYLNEGGISDVGLYPDPEGTGVPPPLIGRPFETELVTCQRYWRFIQTAMASGYAAAGGAVYANYPLTPPMAKAPGVTYGTATNSNASALALNSAAQTLIRFQTTITAAGAGYSYANALLDARI